MVSSARSVVPTHAVCFRLLVSFGGTVRTCCAVFYSINCCWTAAKCSCRPTTCCCKWVAVMSAEWSACWVAQGLPGWLPIGKGKPTGTDGLLACCGEWVADGFDDVADPMLWVGEAAILEGAGCEIAGSHCVDTLTGPLNGLMAGADVGWVDVLAAAKKDGMPWDNNSIWEENVIAMLEEKCCGREVLRLRSAAGEKCCGREVMRLRSAAGDECCGERSAATEKCCGREVLREMSAAGEKCCDW